MSSDNKRPDTGFFLLLPLLLTLIFSEADACNAIFAPDVSAANIAAGRSLLKSARTDSLAVRLMPAGDNLPGKNSPFRIRTVVIDAGHGGYDPGASGSYTREKTVTLAIARMLRDNINSRFPEIKVILTRSTDDFVALDRRAQIAVENRANLFISIHCNASPDPAARGAETYAIGLNSTRENLQVAERENSVILLESDYRRRYEGFDPRKAESYIIFSMVQSHMISRSLKLATKIQAGMGATHGSGVKQAGFLVLRKTTMPSVLVETGFITNPRQEKLLSSYTGQKEIALHIFQGFQNYKNAVE